MKLPKYPSYKASGVEWLGDLPDPWAVKRARFSVAVNPKSRRLTALGPDDEVSFLPMDNVGEYGGLRLDQTRQLADIGAGYTEFDDGDVVIAKITPCFENGKGALASGLTNGMAFGTTELHVLRPGQAVDRRFLFYFTISRCFRSVGEGEMYGAGGQKRVPPEFCKNVALPLPPAEDQCAIADFLDRETARIDALIAKKRTLIERLQEKRTALISRTVTRGLPPAAARAAGLDPNPKLKPSGIDWLGDIPGHWGVGKFSREVRIAEGQVDPEVEPFASMILVAPNHIESGTGRLLATETASDQVAISGKYLCRRGDVLYSKIRPALAKAVLAPVDCLCSADMYPMTSQGVLRSDFLLLVLLSSQFTAWSVLEADRVAMPKINRETLSELRLPVPPPEEQAAIAVHVHRETEQIDQMLAQCGTAVDRLQEYRTALITAAVTGKIDVRSLPTRPGSSAQSQVRTPEGARTWR